MSIKTLGFLTDYRFRRQLLFLQGQGELIAMYAEPRYVNNREWVKNKFLPKSDGIMHV